MTNTDPRRDVQSATPALPLRKGLTPALLLSMLYLAGTAYVSVVTLLDRVQSTDVMKAVSGDIWSRRIAGQMAYFIGALIAVHLVLGLLAGLLARATAEFSREAREKFVLVVVGWFSLLGAAALAPVTFLNWTVKLLRSLNPSDEGILEIFASSLFRSAFAFAILIDIMNFMGLTPIWFVKILQK